MRADNWLESMNYRLIIDILSIIIDLLSIIIDILSKIWSKRDHFLMKNQKIIHFLQHPVRLQHLISVVRPKVLDLVYKKGEK